LQSHISRKAIKGWRLSPTMSVCPRGIEALLMIL